jgi:hypothetical protein
LLLYVQDSPKQTNQNHKWKNKMSNKLVTTPDGREFINRGPINPVADTETAHRMAINEQNILDRHAVAVEALAGEPAGVFVSSATRELAEADLDARRNQTAERVRSGVAGAAMAGGNVELASKLYDYQEVTPAQETPPSAENSADQ